MTASFSFSAGQRRLIWLIAIVLAGAFLRLFQLHAFPVGFHFDEAANVIDLRGIGWGFHPLYFTANNGREPLYFYWAAIFVQVVRDDPFASRLASAFLGIATIPAIYFCFSQMLRAPEGKVAARRIALFAAVGCAFLFFHVNFSRIGLRTISLPLVECLALGLLWRAYRLGKPWQFAVAGLVTGLSLYTYTAARLLAPALLLYSVYWLLTQRRIVRLGGLAVAAGTFTVTVLPLALYALHQPGEFFQRTQGVAVLDRAAVLGNVRAILEMFFVRGSVNGAHNIVGMPLFDWPMRVAFVAGLFLLVPRLRHPAYVFSLLWLACIALASVFSPEAPYYVRLTGLIPPAVLVPALALSQLPS
ncbi:MAG: glycosyltransferase family 39 protein, partial [Chloroflexota bacterium]|nr:glycosyltransferase family 39 protein [Chloroflexota bacterium]